jgi:hypothetical protein
MSAYRFARSTVIVAALWTSARADPAPAPAATPAPIARSRPPAHEPRLRKAGMGLLIGGGACLALGAIFAGLAQNAYDNALAQGKYHPGADDQRATYQVLDGAFFTAGGLSSIAGLVLLW